MCLRPLHRSITRETRRNADGSLDADIREDAYDSSHSEIFGGFSRESGYQ